MRFFILCVLVFGSLHADFDLDGLRKEILSAARQPLSERNLSETLTGLHQGDTTLQSMAKLAGWAATRHEHREAQDDLHVFTSFDENYAPHAAATFASALIARARNETGHLTFYVMESPDKPLTPQTKGKLTDLVEKLGNARSSVIFRMFDETLITADLMKVYRGQLRQNGAPYGYKASEDERATLVRKPTPPRI